MTKVILLLTFGVFGALFTAVPVSASVACELALETTVDATTPRWQSRFSGDAGRKTFARALVKAGLADTAYAVEWSLKDGAEPGPYPRSGSFVSNGVPMDRFQAWLKAVGKETIGLGITGLGAAGNLQSAGLRVGEMYYPYGRIFGGKKPIKFTRKAELTFTEATFFVSPREMRAIEEFLRARGKGQILATRDIRGSVSEGEALNPKWDWRGDFHSVKKESCAGICTSFINLEWLEHYEGARILQRLRDRLQLEDTGVARAMVWRHIRSPEVMGLTQFGIYDVDGKALASNFIGENSYGTLRGLPVYGLIPDPQSGETTQLRSKRIPLQEWLR